jgi:hypothetical protein
VSIAIGLLTVLTPATAAFGLARGTAIAPCTAAPGGWQVLTTAGEDAAAPSGLAVVRVSISGLDPSSCDRLPVKVQIRGNRSGIQSDPAVLALSTLDSRRDPCSGAALPDPLAVHAGAIVLNACPSGGPGGDASIRETTVFRVTIGSTTAVLGEHTRRTIRSSGTGLLPFTGDWSRLLTSLGLLLILAGWILVGVGRRRRGISAN